MLLKLNVAWVLLEFYSACSIQCREFYRLAFRARVPPVGSDVNEWCKFFGACFSRKCFLFLKLEKLIWYREHVGQHVFRNRSWKCFLEVSFFREHSKYWFLHLEKKCKHFTIKNENVHWFYFKLWKHLWSLHFSYQTVRSFHFAYSLGVPGWIKWSPFFFFVRKTIGNNLH